LQVEVIHFGGELRQRQQENRFVPAGREAGSQLDKLGVKIIDQKEFLKLCTE